MLVRARRATVNEGGGIFDAETLAAIGELLTLGEQYGVGVTFTPDAEGWTIGYTVGMGGGDLLSG